VVRFNTDDTEEEMIFNGTYNPNLDVILNCDKCKRTFHMAHSIALRKHENGQKLLCLRCRKQAERSGE
jgi:hypothetical protein